VIIGSYVVAAFIATHSISVMHLMSKMSCYKETSFLAVRAELWVSYADIICIALNHIHPGVAALPWLSE
jgi:hypothetical protein